VALFAFAGAFFSFISPGAQGCAAFFSFSAAEKTGGTAKAVPITRATNHRNHLLLITTLLSLTPFAIGFTPSSLERQAGELAEDEAFLLLSLLVKAPALVKP
jgi:hypothetical protein